MLTGEDKISSKCSYQATTAERKSRKWQGVKTSSAQLKILLLSVDHLKEPPQSVVGAEVQSFSLFLATGYGVMHLQEAI